MFDHTLPPTLETSALSSEWRNTFIRLEKLKDCVSKEDKIIRLAFIYAPYAINGRFVIYCSVAMLLLLRVIHFNESCLLSAQCLRWWLILWPPWHIGDSIVFFPFCLDLKINKVYTLSKNQRLKTQTFIFAVAI